MEIVQILEFMFTDEAWKRLQTKNKMWMYYATRHSIKMTLRSPLNRSDLKHVRTVCTMMSGEIAKYLVKSGRDVRKKRGSMDKSLLEAVI